MTLLLQEQRHGQDRAIAGPQEDGRGSGSRRLPSTAMSGTWTGSRATRPRGPSTPCPLGIGVARPIASRVAASPGSGSCSLAAGTPRATSSYS